MINVAEISLTEKEIEAAVAVLRSGNLRQGKECDAFETEFAGKVGARHAITCANGSATLHLAYMSFIKPGDEVLVPSFTFFATASMVTAAGGVPVVCDVDADSYLIDLADAAKKITPRTVAISPVHLFGNVCDIAAVRSFAETHKLKIVWDAAQAHGGTWQGKDIGSFADFVSYSFYPSKNMFVGEGGMIVTNDDDAARKIRFMRTHGQTGKYLHTMIGLNYRMTDVEAAIGREQLKRLDSMLQRRRQNQRILDAGLKSIPGIKIQAQTPATEHAVHQYCVTIDPDQTGGISRDMLADRLKARGIATGVHYPRAVHQQPIYIEMYGSYRLPVSETLCNRILALPVHHGMSDDDANRVVTEVASALSS